MATARWRSGARMRIGNSFNCEWIAIEASRDVNPAERPGVGFQATS
jgi:hypothetical protein